MGLRLVMDASVVDLDRLGFGMKLGLLISMDSYLRLVLNASVVDLDVEALRKLS